MPVTAVRVGQILVIELHRVHKRNAIDAEMTAGLDAALNLLDDDPELNAGVIWGAGGFFCAGTDLVHGSGPATERGGPYGAVRRSRVTPLIAAVEGLAYGGGFELALSCDLIVAAQDARFALPEVARGLIANSGALFRAPRSLPINIARELLLTGAPMHAERAWSLGLVNELTEPGEARDRAVALAERICLNSPTAVGVTLRAVNSLAAQDDELGWQATSSGQVTIDASQDKREGILAFVEKRQPKWTGR